jgi:hypothetical protein
VTISGRRWAWLGQPLATERKARIALKKFWLPLPAVNVISSLAQFKTAKGWIDPNIS